MSSLHWSSSSLLFHLWCSHVPLNQYLHRFGCVNSTRCPVCGTLGTNISSFRKHAVAVGWGSTSFWTSKVMSSHSSPLYMPHVALSCTSMILADFPSFPLLRILISYILCYLLADATEHPIFILVNHIYPTCAFDTTPRLCAFELAPLLCTR